MVLTCDCNELIKGRRESENSKTWPCLTKKQLRDCLAPYDLARKDMSWNSLLYAAYCSGELYLAKSCSDKISKKIARLPMLQLALGPNVIESGKDLVLFKRINLAGVQKRKTEKSSNPPKQEKTRKAELSKAKDHQDIANVLKAFGG